MVSVSLFKRFLILLYESFLLLAVYFVCGGIATYFFKIIYDPKIPLTQQPEYIVYLLYVLTVFFLYFCFCWVRGGQTLAMKAWRCKVVNEAGGNITTRQALIRYLGAILSWLLLGGGFLLSLVREDRATLHDLLSKSFLTSTASKKNADS